MIGWSLAGMAAIALMAIGIGALVAPRASALQYGIVVDDPRALAFLRAMGIRDVALGAVLGLLAVGRSRSLVAAALYAMAAIALVDWLLVVADGRLARDGQGASSRLLHVAGGFGLLVAGAVLQSGY